MTADGRPRPGAATDPLAAVAALPAVEAAATRARAAVDDLLRHRTLRRSAAAVAVEASLRAAVAAATLQAGVDRPGWDLDAVRADLRAGRLAAAGAGAQGRGTDPAAAALRGAVRVSAEVGSLRSTVERAPLQVLARLHVLAASDVLAAGQLGRPRGPGTDAEDGIPLGSPGDGADVAARLGSLAGLLAAGSAAPAVVVAAVVHGEVLTSRPFRWGNVVVALAAQRLVLLARGVDPQGVSVPEWGHLEQGRAAYVGAAAGYATGTADGVAGWVLHCARAVEIGAREGVAVCAALGQP
jgi:hypothetical protein